MTIGSPFLLHLRKTPCRIARAVLEVLAMNFRTDALLLCGATGNPAHRLLHGNACSHAKIDYAIDCSTNQPTHRKISSDKSW